MKSCVQLLKNMFSVSGGRDTTQNNECDVVLRYSVLFAGGHVMQFLCEILHFFHRMYLNQMTIG